MNVFAAEQSLGKLGGVGLGPFGNINTGDRLAGINGVINTVSSIVGIMTVTGGIWFLFMILFAGYEWISAGGDAKKLASARDRITHAFTGLVIVVGSWSLLAVAGQFFGFNTLVDPNVIINTLPIK